MNSPPLNAHYEDQIRSQSDHDETLGEDHESDVSACGSDTDDFVDLNSLAAMEHSQSPPIDD
jgi:hypothetical protein